MAKELTEEEYDQWLKLTRKKVLDFPVFVGKTIAYGIMLILLLLVAVGIKYVWSLL